MKLQRILCYMSKMQMDKLPFQPLDPCLERGLTSMRQPHDQSSMTACCLLDSLSNLERAQSPFFKRTAWPEEAAWETCQAVLEEQFLNHLSHAKLLEACTIEKSENISNCPTFRVEGCRISHWAIDRGSLSSPFYYWDQQLLDFQLNRELHWVS